MRFENDRFINDDDLSAYCFEVVRLASLNKTPKEISYVFDDRIQTLFRSSSMGHESYV